MMHRLDSLFFSSQSTKRLVNQTYTYLLHFLHLILNLSPGFVRNRVFALLLAKCGEHVYFDYNVYFKFPWLVEIGDNVGVHRGVEFYPEYQGRHRIIIGSDVYLAPHVRLFAAGHAVDDLTQHIGANIVVEDNVWIGANSIVLQGVRIGHDSIIGAGSVVTGDVAPNVIAAGNPARVIRDRRMP